jgi:DNA-binding XRE family transcriptional regulator
MGKKKIFMDVADRLKLIRAATNAGSQRVLAQRLKIEHSTYAQWEAGVNLIPVHEAVKLCVMFGVTLDWIYRGDVSGLPLRVMTLLESQSENIVTTDDSPEKNSA